MIASDRLAQVFVEVADTLVDEFDMIDFLQKVTAQASGLSVPARPDFCSPTPRVGCS